MKHPLETAVSRSHQVRQRIWTSLRDVALPDSRFHLNFAEVIPDFVGSGEAIDRVVEREEYRRARLAFVTPDNCLVELRRRLILDRVPFVVSTYGIYRGFVLIEPDSVPPGAELYAAWLDGLEHFGRPISLAETAALGRFDLMVTGASAVSRDGVRFGKGHGFFDLEWGMFTEVGIVDERTPVIAVVHDCQLVDERLEPSETDILVDLVATPTELHVVERRARRPRGVRWDLLEAEQLEATPPLRELQRTLGLA